MFGTGFRRFATGSSLLLLFGVMVCPPARGSYLVAGEMTGGTADRFTADGQKTVLSSTLGQPLGVAIDAAGNVFVAEISGDRITEISPSGTQHTFYQFDSQVDNPEGLTIGPDGALYVCGTIDNPTSGVHNVYRIDATGHATVYASVGMQESGGLVFDADGNLYVSDLYNNGTLWKVTPDKQVSTFVTGQGYMTGLAIAPDGHTIFAATWLYNTVLRITPDGQSSVFATPDTPWGLTFDSTGNLYVGQSTQITKYDTNGVPSVFATGLHDVRGLASAPEPSTLALLGSVALAGLITRRKMRRR